MNRDSLVGSIKARVAPFVPQSILRRRWVEHELVHGEGELSVAKKLLPKGGTLVDIGANSGIYSAMCVQSGGRAVAFEPVPAECERLRDMLGDKGEVHQVALGDAFGEAVLFVPYTQEGDVTTRSSLHAELDSTLAHRSIDVEIATLDSFALSTISVLKIDVEGHEAAVLRGARATLERLRPAVIIEVEDERLPGVFVEVCDLLEGLGYTGYWLDGGKPRKIAEFDLTLNQDPTQRPQWGESKSDGYVNNFVWLGEAVSRHALGWPS